MQGDKMKKIAVFFVCILFVSFLTACTEETVAVSSMISSMITTNEPQNEESASAEEVDGTKLVSYTEQVKTYQITTSLAHIEGYATLKPFEDTCSYDVTVPLPLAIEGNNIVTSIEAEPAGAITSSVKVGEIVSCLKLRDDETFSDLLEIDETYAGVISQLDVGMYRDKNNRPIYYDVCEVRYNGLWYQYSFVVPLTDDTAVFILFFSENDDRTKDEPYFREIVNTVKAST